MLFSRCLYAVCFETNLDQGSYRYIVHFIEETENAISAKYESCFCAVSVM